MEKKNNRKAVLSVKEAAEYLGVVSHRTLEKWRRRGIGPKSVKLGGKTVGYRISDLEKYLDDHTQVPGEDFVA